MAKIRNKGSITSESTTEKTVNENTENTQDETAETTATEPAVAAEAPVTEPAVETPAEPAAATEAPVVEDEAAAEAAEAPAEAPVTETQDEPAAPVEAPVQPVAAPAVEPKVEDQSASEQDITEEAAYLNNIRLNGTKLQKNILAALESFIEKTKPRMPVTPEQGARAQNDLLDWLLAVLDAEPDEFRKAWQVALVFFKEFHGNTNSPSGYTALSEYRSCAFREAWVDQDRLMAYTNLVTLLRATRNVKTRQNDIKTISLDKIAPEVLDETRLSNLKRFYGV